MHTLWKAVVFKQFNCPDSKTSHFHYSYYEETFLNMTNNVENISTVNQEYNRSTSFLDQYMNESVIKIDIIYNN